MENQNMYIYIYYINMQKMRIPKYTYYENSNHIYTCLYINILLYLYIEKYWYLNSI